MPEVVFSALRGPFWGKNRIGTDIGFSGQGPFSKLISSGGIQQPLDPSLGEGLDAVASAEQDPQDSAPGLGVYGGGMIRHRLDDPLSVRLDRSTVSSKSA